MTTVDYFLLWENDDSLDKWYNSTIDPALQPKKTGCDDYANSELVIQDQAANDWFYSLDHSDEAVSADGPFETTIDTSDAQRWSALQATVPVSDFKHGINKPLPRDPPSPYFEYLFANAGVETITKRDAGLRGKENKTFDDELMLDAEHDVAIGNTASTASSSSREEPSTPPTAWFSSTYTALNSIDPINTETNTLEQFDKVEKHSASVGFYGGFDVEESPSPFHAPNVDYAAGFGDIRDGAEAFPEQWTRNEEQAESYTLAEADDLMQIDSRANTTTNGKLHIPKSYDANAMQEGFVQIVTPMVTSFDSHSSEPSTFSGKTSSTKNSKKRKATDSFVASGKHDTDNSDDEVQYLYTKKIRLDSSIQANNLETKSIHRSPTYSLITEGDEEDITKVSPAAGKTLSNVKLTGHALNGFPGQYCGLEETKQCLPSGCLKHNSSNSVSTPNSAFTFGDPLHPNYLYTHTNFTVCPIYTTTEYIHTAPIPSESIMFANDQQILAAAMHRAAAEEALRREVHYECALARLEGCSVGRYRYYQGHMNIEEYKDANMCICWEICSCSKMCTRYGDLMCPCSGEIQLLEH